jgi:hypothetical protein
VETLEPGAVYYVELVYVNRRTKFMTYDCVQVGLYSAVAPDPFSSCFTYSSWGWGLSCTNGQLRHESVDGGVKIASATESGDILGMRVDMVLGTLTFYINGALQGGAWAIPEFSCTPLKVAAALCEYKSQVTLLNGCSKQWRSRRGWIYTRRMSKAAWLKRLSAALSREVALLL